MITSANFKVRLVELPKVKDAKGDLKNLGHFTLGRKYRVYAIYEAAEKFTDFLIADDKREFIWLNMWICRAV